jgi:cytochrome P450
MNRYPPGPSDWFFGLRIAAQARRDPLQYFVHMAQTYGDVLHIRCLGRHLYIINRPEAVREVLVSKGKSFCKVEQFKRVMRQVDGNGLIVSEGDFWLRQRRLVQQAFHPRRMAGYAGAMVEQTQRMLRHWQTGMEMNIEETMTHLTLDMVAKTLFGVELGGQEAQFRQAVRILSEEFTREFNAVVALPEWLPLRSKRRKCAAIRFLHQFIRDIVRQRRASGEDRGDLLSMLLLAVDEEGDARGMTDEQARDEAMTLFNAGHDSTAAALTWIWYLIARDPAVQTRIALEVDQVIGGRPATFADVAQLSYTASVVRESLRLYPPTWSLFAREALADVEVGGYLLPRGSWAFVFPYVLHRDPRWFPEPERFDPDRFAVGRVEQIPQYAYIPFGAGPHACIGNAFASMEMVLIVATVAQQFRVELASGQGVPVPEPLIALRPNGGVRLTVRRRAPAATAGLAIQATVGTST